MREETGNYIFPKKLAYAMTHISQRTQYEAALLSMSFILVGMLVTAVYIVFFTDFPIFLRIMTGVNMLAGFFFLSSFITTTFQQYQNHLAVTGIIMDEKQSEIDAQLNRLKGGENG